MPRFASGFFINVSQTNPVRAFSAISIVIPVSIPTTSVSYQFFSGIEGVHESIAAPGRSIVILDVLQDTHHRLRKKWQRTAGRAGNDGAIDRSHRRWPTPNHVALLRIRRRDAPEIVAVVRKLLCQFQTETAMHVGGDRRVLKVIGVLIALAAEIKPGLRILMHKQRRERTDVAEAVIFERDSLPRVPGFGRQRMRTQIPSPGGTSSSARCSSPSDRAESRFRESIRAAITRCLPTASVQSTRLKISYANRLISECLEVLPAGKNSAEQNGRVDGRDFGIPHPLAGVDVGEVIEESAMSGHFFPEKTQSRHRALASFADKDTKPRFCPMQRAVSPNPVAAILATIPVSFVCTLHRSLTSPVCGLPCSQK